MIRSTVVVGALGVLSLGLSGCMRDKSDDEQVMTRSEALEAVDESSIASQAADLTSASIEISTNFTIGSAVANAAEELRAFIATQLPCADVRLTNATLHVTYGAKPGNCIYHGNTFSGETEVTVSRNDDGGVEVDHTWTGFSNGKLKVDGTAKVTWSKAEASRRVEHSLTWTRLADGRTGTGTGDRTQKALDGGIAVGFREDGSRAWEGPKGRWDLGIAGVEMRWADPVPQAGTYTLTTPNDKSLTLSYARVDADTIKVTVASGGRSFSFDVNALGVATDG